MNYTLKIYKDRELVNEFQSDEEAKVLTEFKNAALYEFVHHYRVKVKKMPYEDHIQIKVYWEDDVLGHYRYDYDFYGLIGSAW